MRWDEEGEVKVKTRGNKRKNSLKAWGALTLLLGWYGSVVASNAAQTFEERNPQENNQVRIRFACDNVNEGAIGQLCLKCTEARHDRNRRVFFIDLTSIHGKNFMKSKSDADNLTQLANIPEFEMQCDIQAHQYLDISTAEQLFAAVFPQDESILTQSPDDRSVGFGASHPPVISYACRLFAFGAQKHLEFAKPFFYPIVLNIETMHRDLIDLNYSGGGDSFENFTEGTVADIFESERIYYTSLLEIKGVKAKQPAHVDYDNCDLADVLRTWVSTYHYDLEKEDGQRLLTVDYYLAQHAETKRLDPKVHYPHDPYLGGSDFIFYDRNSAVSEFILYSLLDEPACRFIMKRRRPLGNYEFWFEVDETYFNTYQSDFGNQSLEELREKAHKFSRRTGWDCNDYQERDFCADMIEKLTSYDRK